LEKSKWEVKLSLVFMSDLPITIWKLTIIILYVQVNMLLIKTGMLYGMKNAEFLLPMFILPEAIILSQRINIYCSPKKRAGRYE